MIEDKRNHLRQYPASCSARTGREEAFDKLYPVMQENFGMSHAEVDAEYRTFEDYIYAELEYTQSKTCCWNNSTAAMAQIILEYNQSLQQQGCQSPVVFKWNGGYEVFKQYAIQTGRGNLWKDWSADEPCAQQGVAADTEVATDATAWCSLDQTTEPPPAECTDDGFEQNDSAAAPASMNGGTHAGLMVCAGDDDFYAFTAATSLTVGITFQHAQGDLDLELYKDGALVTSSTSTSDAEQVTATGAGSYVVRVLGYSGAAGAYTMNATVN
jgi:hypothetical protein